MEKVNQIRIKILEKIYENDWMIDEDDARSWGIEYSLEMLNLIEEGIIRKQSDYSPWTYGQDESNIYIIPQAEKKRILEFIIENKGKV